VFREGSFSDSLYESRRRFWLVGVAIDVLPRDVPISDPRRLRRHVLTIDFHYARSCGNSGRPSLVVRTSSTNEVNDALDDRDQIAALVDRHEPWRILASVLLVR